MSNNTMYAKLLEKVVADRPDLAQYAELFQHLGEDNDADENRTKELEAKLHKVSSIARQLQKDLRGALAELDDFAKALGACECWGTDNRCPVCQGKGQVGFYKPDRLLFYKLIFPALAAMPWIEVKEI